MILRKSGKSGPGTKRPHFAHKSLTPNCTPESALHYAFKTQLYETIKEHLSLGDSIEFYWHCDKCGQMHNGDILKKTKAIELAYNMKACQPDIALLDEQMNVFAVIEIVVTHYPEMNVLQYYRNNNIFLIQYKLYDEKELLEFETKIKRPDRVDLCKSPKCKACGNHLQKKIMTIVNGPCWKCNSNMNIASISTSKRTIIRGISNFLAPGNFNKEEIKAARDNNVHLKHHYSRTAGYTYLANTCPKCNAFVGDHYIFTDYISQTGNDELFSYDVDLGYYCEYCNDRLYLGDDEY